MGGAKDARGRMKNAHHRTPERTPKVTQVIETHGPHTLHTTRPRTQNAKRMHGHTRIAKPRAIGTLCSVFTPCVSSTYERLPVRSAVVCRALARLTSVFQFLKGESV